MNSVCNRFLMQFVKKPFTMSIKTAAINSCKMMNDPFEHATGLEKKILEAEKGGNCDPFQMLCMRRGPGTKEEPNLIPSAFDGRLVGCICIEEQTHIQYMWLTKDKPKRCECGYWFKLVESDPVMGH